MIGSMLCRDMEKGELRHRADVAEYVKDWGEGRVSQRKVQTLGPGSALPLSSAVNNLGRSSTVQKYFWKGDVAELNAATFLVL